MATSNKKHSEHTVPETSTEVQSLTHVNTGSKPLEGSKPSDESASVTIVEMDDDSAKAKNLIGDFEVIKVLGKGGMGTVYLAQQKSLDRLCALKVMSKKLNSKTNFVIRFQREAKLMAKIDHPNVVKCYAIGKDNGLHHVAMEYIDGQSMKQWVRQLKRLSIPDAIHVTLACADALAYAHQRNMIHRDIKPDNILVTQKGEVKVADLGLAKDMEDNVQMTQAGTGLGTPYYMAPEQARNAADVDGQCDIYALGCSLYNFVTGRLPFKADSTLNLIIEKEKGIFEPASRKNPEVPEELDQIIQKMMARQLDARYKTCEEVINDLETLKRHSKSLGFIDSPEKVEMIREASPSGRPSKSEKPPLPPDMWHVRRINSQGKTVVGKLDTKRIRDALKAGKLDLKTQVRKDRNKPFSPIAEFAEFDAEIEYIQEKLKPESVNQIPVSSSEKVDQQHWRLRWWDFLPMLKEGTLGWPAILLLLGVVVAAICSLYLIGRLLF